MVKCRDCLFRESENESHTLCLKKALLVPKELDKNRVCSKHLKAENKDWKRYRYSSFEEKENIEFDLTHKPIEIYNRYKSRKEYYRRCQDQHKQEAKQKDAELKANIKDSEKKLKAIEKKYPREIIAELL